MSAFSKFDHHQFSDSCPILLEVFHCKWNTTLFLIHVRRMTNVLLEIFLRIKTNVELAIHFFSLSFISPYDVIEHRHEDNYSLKLIWVAHFVHELLDFLDELQCCELFHSNSMGSQSIVSKVLYCDECLNQSNCRSQAVFDVGF